MSVTFQIVVDIRDRALRRDDILDAVAVGAKRELNWRVRGCVRDVKVCELVVYELSQKPISTQAELL